MVRVITLGKCAADSIYRVAKIPTRPVKVESTKFVRVGGGMAANASVALARLGAGVELWSRLGDDPLGDEILTELRAEGVDVGFVRRLVGATSPSAAILLAPDGERLICSFNDRDWDPDPSWLPLARITAADAVLTDVRWPEGACVALAAAVAARIPAILDGDAAPPETLLQLSRCATVAVYSEQGLAALVGGGAPGAGLRQVARDVTAIVGVTLGCDGVLLLADGHEEHVASPHVTAVDTIGAGDVWHGAFTLAVAERQPLLAAARFANAAAALKCTREYGRCGAPSRPEVEHLLAESW